MKVHRSAFFVLNVWQDPTIQVSQEDAPNVPEEDYNEEKLQISENKNIPASETLYAPAEDVRALITNALKVQGKDSLQRRIDDSTNKDVHNLFGAVYKKPQTETYTELF